VGGELIIAATNTNTDPSAAALVTATGDTIAADIHLNFNLHSN
jgi:hypothetical protein